MTSNDRSDRIDLERGLPTDAQDVAALRALRHPRMTDEEYVRFLAALEPPSGAELLAKSGPRGAPFRL